MAIVNFSLVLGLALIHFACAEYGAMYTRWGRTDCSRGSVKLYSGFMATSHYVHSGNGGNYLCLPSEPEFGHTVPGWQAVSGRIYGVEYELFYGYEKGFLGDEQGNLLQQDAPCAVCYRSGRVSQIMIPGRYSCPSSLLTYEYSGYVFSEYHSHAASTEFICLDSDPDVIPGGQANNDQGVIYPVEVGCGSLPCPPYADGKELACVVCTA
jgi:hypothetical protein